MTTTVKLNPSQLLTELAESNSYGCLDIDSELVSWKIYLHQGKIQYVYCSIQTLDQLKYHLHYLKYKQAIAAFKDLPPSFSKLQPPVEDKSATSDLYGKIISWLLAEDRLNMQDCTKLVQNLNKDAIQSFLSLNNAASSWRDGQSLPIWIPVEIRDSLSWSVSECLNERQVIVRQWQNCSQELRSVHQRPYFPPGWETKTLPVSGSLDRKTLKELTQVLRGRTSIRQLSILLNKEELQIAQILSPYIDEKTIYLHHAQAPLDKLPQVSQDVRDIGKWSPDANNDSQITQHDLSRSSVKTWKIVCIDDSPTILSEIKRFLDAKKFEITAIDDPVQAVSKIFTVNPDLILLDITMPRINGYKLCGLLRSSGKCDDTPIVMVTGNTGLIDKARAKISGATDYFTKPFTKEGLNKIVDKYLQ